MGSMHTGLEDHPHDAPKLAEFYAQKELQRGWHLLSPVGSPLISKVYCCHMQQR